MNWTNGGSFGFSDAPWGIFGDFLDRDSTVCKMPIKAGGESGTTWLTPRTEMLELSDSVKLILEMPGATQESVDATIENDVLTIQGSSPAMSFDGSDGKKLEYAERKYRRSFTLSDQLNTEGIEAVIRNGLLTVNIPRAEKVKPRKIAVKAES